MAKILESDADLFAAALSQTVVSVWQSDLVGVYCEIDRGIINKLTKESIRLRTTADEVVYYFRDEETTFRAEIDK